MPQIAGNTVEGLFIHALKVSGPIVAKLKQIGFDAERLEPAYEIDVWRKALRIAGDEYYPGLTPQDAEFQLGVRLVDGYFTTIVGKMIQAAMPFLKAETLCLRLPRYFNTGVVGETQPPIITKLGDRHFQTTLFGATGVPYLAAGSVDAVLRKTKVKPLVKVDSINAGSFTLDITWVDGA